MKKLITCIGLLLLAVNCFASTVYIEDNGVIIPIHTDNGDITTVNNADGTQTSVYDWVGRTDVVHGDGTTTSVYDNGYVQ